MDQQLLSTFTLISSISVVLPLAVSFIRIRHHTIEQRLLFYLLISSTLTEAGANLLWYMGENNLIIYHFYGFFNFLFISSIHRKKLGQKLKKPLLYFQIAYLFFVTLNSLFLQPVSTFNTNVSTSSGLIFLMFGISHFYKLLKDVQYQELEKKPIFWINSGIVIYYSSTLILFLLMNEFNDGDMKQRSAKVTMIAFGLNSFFNIVLNTLYSIAQWVRPKT